jgi:pyridoxamine 5'-phosphate oxidase
MHFEETLPEILPSDPLAVAAAWLAEAWERREQPNPDSMVLATTDGAGRPSARVVLCKGIVAGAGFVRFVSNYESRKGQELAANPRAAIVMHWDHRHRQVRIEGVVRKATPAESDAYFAGRAWASRLGAHASRQSQPIGSRAELSAAFEAVAARYGAEESPGASVPRPAHWGGYELHADTVELWTEGAARIHDRARWTRELATDGAGGFRADAWTSTRLQP